MGRINGNNSAVGIEVKDKSSPTILQGTRNELTYFLMPMRF